MGLLDYSQLIRQSRSLNPSATIQHVRIAILADAASQQFVPLLKVLFHQQSVNAEIYEGAFAAFELETFDPHSSLYEFRPDVIVVANCTQALRSRYYQHSAGDFVDVAWQRILTTWNAIERHSTSRIIQCNYPLPYERWFGNYESKAPQTLYAVTAELNRRIAQYAKERSNVLVCDVESTASYIGHKQWFDERMWVLCKAFCNLEYLPCVANALVQIVLSSLGRTVKCVILDLDNTLWGGTVGDDGPLGITVGPHGDGEPFYHLQNYLLTLKRRGILLAVCSKNSLETAVQPFLQNPDMVLKREDITVFIANWQNKADNIREIREIIGIGFDSIVFLDDNAFERNLVREFLPAVIVPELPDDPADYVRALCELNLFETSSFSAEDLVRSELYRQEACRRDLKSRFATLDEYLESLEMRIHVARFELPKISRIVQLFQRSNQFNLTTHRYSERECEKMMRDQDNVTPLYATLSDRFGDHGLIALVVLNVTSGEAEISDWVMSCRVLSRGVEQFLMNRVVAIATQKGLKRIYGRYIPTAKNTMVRDFYAQFGFQRSADNDGSTEWSLDPVSYKPVAVHISEAE